MPRQDPHPKTSVARQFLQYLPGTAIPMIIALASSAIFTRLLRPDEFGRYMLVLTSASLIVALASRWLEQGVARYLPKVAWSEARTSILEPTALGITLATLLAGVVAMSVSLVAVLLGLSVWLPFLLPASIFVLATAVQQPLLAVLLGEQQAGSYSLFRVGPSAVQFVTSLILVSLVDAGAPGLMWGSALGAAALLPFLIRATGIAQHVPTWRQWAQQLPHLRTFARYGIPMTGWFVAAVLLFAGDRWIIELTRDSSEVGIYSANSNLMQGAAIFIAMPLILTMHPRLMRAWDREGPAVAASLLGRSVSYGIPAATIAIGLTALTFPEIAIVLLGAEFREGAFIMPIVLAGLVFWELANYLQKPLEFFLKTRLMVAAALSAAGLNIGLNVALVPRFGYAAAAWTTFISFFVYAVFVLFTGRRLVPWTVTSKSVVFDTGISVVGMSLAVLIRFQMVGLPSTMRLVVAGSVAAATVAFVGVRLARSGEFGPIGGGHNGKSGR